MWLRFPLWQQSSFPGAKSSTVRNILICLTLPDPRGKRDVLFAKRKDWGLSWGRLMRHTIWACPAASINYDLLKCIFFGAGTLGKLLWILRSYNWMRWNILWNKVIWNAARFLDWKCVVSMSSFSHIISLILHYKSVDTRSPWGYLEICCQLAQAKDHSHGKFRTDNDIFIIQ